MTKRVFGFNKYGKFYRLCVEDEHATRLILYLTPEEAADLTSEVLKTMGIVPAEGLPAHT